MSFISSIIDTVTGALPDAAGEVISSIAGGFGLGGYGNITSIIEKLSTLSNLNISDLASLASVDTNLLGQLIAIGSGDFNFADLGALNNVTTQISELNPDIKNTISNLISNFPIEQALKDKFTIK